MMCKHSLFIPYMLVRTSAIKIVHKYFADFFCILWAMTSCLNILFCVQEFYKSNQKEIRDLHNILK